MARALSATGLIKSRESDYVEIENWYRDLLANTPPPTDLEWEPVKIGPTWQWDNGWLLPAATLGWGMLAWCGYWLTGKGRAPWAFTPEQARFLLWYYAVDGAGDFTYHSAMLQRLKGWGKDPIGATVSAASLHAPIVFDRWDGDRAVGRDEPDAWTQVIAVSQDQTKNTMKLFPSLISPDAIRHYGIQIGKLNVWSDGDRRQIEAVTASPAAIEGGRPKQVIRNETQNWNKGNGGHDMAGAIEGNAAKSARDAPARILDIFNAYRPGEDSVAERARVGWEEAQGDDAIRLDYGVLLDSLEAPPNAPLTPEVAPSVVRSIAGDSAWLDTRANGRIVKSILNPANSASEPIAHYERVLTPGGFVKHGDLAVGDGVYASDGSVTTVTRVFDEVFADTYRLTFQDGATLDCTGSHRLPMDVRGASDGFERVTLSVDEMLRHGLVHRRMTKGVLFRYRRLPAPAVNGVRADLCGIDPYVLGYWLGDGTSVCGQFRVGRDDIDTFVANVARPMTPLRLDETGNYRPTVYGLRGQLARMGVLGNKHIPAPAMRGTVEQRRAILGGLIDSDGTCRSDGRIHICVLNNRLGDDIFALAVSLGLMPSRSYRNDRRHVNINFTQTVPMARLTRKSVIGAFSGRALTLTSIERIPDTPCRCIEVAHADHEYLVTENSIVSHNSRRKWYNQVTGTEDAWIEPRWADQCVDRGLTLVDGDQIVMFGDGSKSGDDTGIVACRVSDGACFVLHHQHPKADQIISRANIDADVTEAFDRFKIAAFFFDPSHAKDDGSAEDDRFFWPLVDDWHKRYGRRLKLHPIATGNNRHSVAFDMLSPAAQKLFQPAVQQAAEDLEAGLSPIIPSAVLLRHMKNARRRDGRYGLSIGKENRSSQRKIDLAVCFVGARMLRRQLLVTKRSGSAGKGRVILM